MGFPAVNSDLQRNAFLSNIAHSNALPGAVFAAAENIIAGAGVIKLSYAGILAPARGADVTTRVRSRPISAIATFRRRRAIPPWRRSGSRNSFEIDCRSDHVHSRKTPTAKRLLLFLGMIVASIGTQAVAQSGGFPCDAFKVQPNGRLEVVRPVTITGPNGKMTLNSGISFGPEGLYMGANIFELYQKNCH